MNSILDENPRGVFLSGDITEGPFLESTLEFLGKRIGRPLYFVLGNHDTLLTSFQSAHSKVRALCKRYRNLIWMTEAGIIELTPEVALVGMEGWYDARVGNPDYIRFTFDWWMTEDFRKLPDMHARLQAFRDLAIKSAETLSARVEEAVARYKVVYLLTHYPPWEEAHRSTNPWFEKFWQAYNCNIALGEALERVMEKHKNRQLIVLCGHTHQNTSVIVSRNTTCQVGQASYTHLTDGHRIYI